MASTKIFISYAREDKAFVADIASRLEDHRSIAVFWDKKREPGNDWPQEVTSRATEADALIVFISRAACKSSYVPKEVLFASKNSRLIIVPILLEALSEGECNTLEFLITGLQRINAVGRTPAVVYEEIVKALHIAADAPLSLTLAAMSTQGGTGKSTTVIAMAELFASAGNDVTIIDTDVVTRGITTYLEPRVTRRPPRSASVLDLPEKGPLDDAHAGKDEPLWDVTPTYLREDQFGRVLLIPSRSAADTRDAFDILSRTHQASEILPAMRAITERARRACHKGPGIVLIDCEGTKNTLVSAAFVVADYGFIVVRPDPRFRHDIAAAEALHRQRFPNESIAPMQVVVNQAMPDTPGAGWDPSGTDFLPDDPEIRNITAKGGTLDFEGVGLNHFYLAVVTMLHHRLSEEHVKLLPDQAKIWIKPYLEKLKTFPDKLLAEKEFRWLTATTAAYWLAAVLCIGFMGFLYYTTDRELATSMFSRQLEVPPSENVKQFEEKLKEFAPPKDLAQKVQLEDRVLRVHGSLSADEAVRLKEGIGYEPLRTAAIELTLLADIGQKELLSNANRVRQIALVAALLGIAVVVWRVIVHRDLRSKKRLLEKIVAMRGSGDQRELSDFAERLLKDEQMRPEMKWLRDEFRRRADPIWRLIQG